MGPTRAADRDPGCPQVSSSEAGKDEDRVGFTRAVAGEIYTIMESPTYGDLGSAAQERNQATK